MSFLLLPFLLVNTNRRNAILVWQYEHFLYLGCSTRLTVRDLLIGLHFQFPQTEPLFGVYIEYFIKPPPSEGKKIVQSLPYY